MSNNLSFSLKLNIQPFSEALKSALTMGQRFNEQINGVMSGKITVDTSVFDLELKNLNKKIASFKSMKIENDITIEDKASSVIDRVTRQASESYEKQKGAIRRVQESLSGLGFAMQGITAIGRVLNGTVGDLINSAGVQEKAERKVEQAVKQTGMAAGYTAEELKVMASGMQELTTIGDEDIMNNVTAQMLTFTNITQDQFKEAQKQALNLATVLDGDLKSASIQLGKALNDPITNLSALSRSGIQFTAEQKEMVKELWNAGKQAEAQNIILAELNRQYGGQAEAMAGTYSGALKQFSNKWGDLKETLGMGILPVLAKLADWLKTVVGFLDDFFKGLSGTSLERNIRELRELGAAAKDIAELEKFAMQQQLIEINNELKKTGIEFTKIESVTERIKSINEEKIQLVKDEATFSKRERYDREDLLRIWRSLGLTYTEAKQKVKEYNQSIDAGVFLTANSVIIQAIKKRKKELDDETEKILEQKDLLLEREKLERRINTILPDGKLDDSSAEELKDAKEIERLQKLAELRVKYNLRLIADQEKRAVRELEIEREKELKKAENLKASNETLKQIRESYENDIDKVRKDAEEKRQQEQQSAQDAVFEVENRALQVEDPQKARLNAQLRTTENFFAKKHDMLIKAGWTEQQIIEAEEKAKQDIIDKYNKLKLKGGLQTLTKLAEGLGKHSKAAFKISKALNIAQVVMETPAAAMAAYRSVIGMPVVGPALAPIAFAAAIAQGAMTVAEISKAKPPKAAKGGLSGILAGASHDNGGLIIEAEGGEYIINKETVARLGKNFFDFVNYSPAEEVANRFSGVEMPSIPAPVVNTSYYATGGQVGSNSIASEIVAELRSMKAEIRQLKDNRPVVNVNVDPINGRTEELSELVDEGYALRSEI